MVCGGIFSLGPEYSLQISGSRIFDNDITTKMLRGESQEGIANKF